VDRTRAIQVFSDLELHLEHFDPLAATFNYVDVGGRRRRCWPPSGERPDRYARIESTNKEPPSWRKLDKRRTLGNMRGTTVKRFFETDGRVRNWVAPILPSGKRGRDKDQGHIQTARNKDGNSPNGVSQRGTSGL
jgi:hypothetical protein